MAQRQFGQMLNEVLSLKLMRNSYLWDTYIFRKCKDRDQGWHGGPYMVPFEAGESSNYRSGGGLVKKAEIGQDRFIRGYIPDYKIIHGAVTFYEQDLREHGRGAKMPRDTFLKLKIAETLMKNKSRFQFMFTHQLLNGGGFVKVSAAPTAVGKVAVDHPERLTIGQKLVFVTSPRTAAAQLTTSRYGINGWVSAININTGVIDVKTDQSLATDLDLQSVGIGGPSGSEVLFGLAQDDNIYLDGDAGIIGDRVTANSVTSAGGAITLPDRGGLVGDPAYQAQRANDASRALLLGQPNSMTAGGVQRIQGQGGFTSLASQILPAGDTGSLVDGSNSLFGVDKRQFPFLQSITRDAGGTVMLGNKAVSFVHTMYDLFTDFIIKGQPASKGMDGNRTGETGIKALRGRSPRTVDAVMSLRWFGVLQKYFLGVRGDYFKKVSGSTINFLDVDMMYINGPDGTMLRVVGVKSMRDDLVYFLGDDTLRFSSLNFIKVYESPDGNKWTVDRQDETGFQWICDYSIYGDLILKRPAGAAVLYNLPDPNTITVFTN